MKFSIGQIAQLIGGEVEGDQDQCVDQFYKIEEGKSGGISFLSNPKYEPYIYQTDSTAVIVSKDFKPKMAIKSNLIKVDDPYLAFTKLLSEYQKIIKTKEIGIHPSAIIDPSAHIGKNVSIGPFVVIESNVFVGNNSKVESHAFLGTGSKLGEGCTIEQGAKVLYGCTLGDYVHLHPGCVIGSEGFGFAPDENGLFKAIPQLGNVVLGDHVSVGANTTIDRATMGSTSIADGVKLDNLIQVGHNVQIGRNTVIAGQTGIAGSAKIGANCMIGGQVGIAGHLSIANGTKISAQSGVNKNITEEGTSIGGSFHMDYKQYLKTQVMLRKLPDIIKELEKRK